MKKRNRVSTDADLHEIYLAGDVGELRTRALSDRCKFQAINRGETTKYELINQ